MPGRAEQAEPEQGKRDERDQPLKRDRRRIREQVVLGEALDDRRDDCTPPTTLLGFKFSDETVGRGGGVTVTEADALEPP